MPTPADTRTPSSSVCPECGTIWKSGTRSCCARGGSWFGNCGVGGDGNLGHTWQEGIRACKARQSAAVVGHQLHAFQPKSNIPFGDASMDVDSKAVIVATHMFASAPANMSAPISVATPIIWSVGPPTTRSDQNSTAYDNGITVPSLKGTAAKPTITLSANPTITPQANPAIIKPKRNISGDMFMTTSSHRSTSASITSRDCKNPSHVVARISIVIIIICWY